MQPFRLSITRAGKLSLACPICGSTQVEVVNYPVNEVDQIRCRKCGYTLYRPLPQPKNYHQVTVDELNDKDKKQGDINA